MGGCCCCSRKTTDLPEKYKENRSCTDIIFAILFILAWGAFIALAVVAFQAGDLKSVLYGHDYLGYYCGEGAGPENFASHIPIDAEYQSQNWEENKFVWYPVPLSKGLSGVLDISGYGNLGVCVKSCPKVNITGLSEIINGNVTESDALKHMTIYSYGNVSVEGVSVNSASTMYSLYDTTDLLRKCFPSVVQPSEVQEQLSQSPVINKAYTFAMQGVNEIQNSWRVFLIEIGICIILCFLFVLLMRFMISCVVWMVLLAVFLLLAGGGGICFFLYHTKGKSDYLRVDGVESYSTLFLILAIILWVLSVIYLFILLALCTKIRLVCSIIKISSRVLASAPTLLFVPVVTSIFIIGVLAWTILIAMSLYTAHEKGTALTLVPVTDAIKYNGASVVPVNGTQYYEVITQAINTKNSYQYLMIADLFGFLWTMGFLNAVCFTTIAFVSVFWYFSNLEDSSKSVPVCGVCRAVFWTLFYHAGTLALGSFLIAIVQTLRFLLAYFAKKARAAVGDNQLVKCIICYLQCFLACFERILSVINKNAYIMMCLTSECFCFAACGAISLIMNYAVELLFLSWMVEVVTFFGKLFVVGGCCVSTYFLCTLPVLAPDVEVKVMPVIVVGVMSFFLSSVFFSVYSAAADALLVSYCYDRKINATRGFYYVPEELEHQIGDYSQREKLKEFNAKQAAAHRQGGGGGNRE